MVSRVLIALYLTALALIPWTWFPPFPWLHAHAQWSDAVFAATFALWVVEKLREGKWPRFRPVHAAIALYLCAAAFSALLSSADRRAGLLKTVGIAELCALAVVTADLVARPR